MNKVLSPLDMVFVCLLHCAGQADTVYISVSGSDAAVGTVAAPWRTIQRGVEALKPGDALLIGPGTYRERIEIKHGGTARAPMSSSPARIASRADGAEDGPYVHDWAYRFPIGGPNELTHPGDREHQLTGRAERVIHGGRLLRQVLTRQQLAPGTFFANLDAKQLDVWLRGSDDPNDTEMEASTRGEWLVATSVRKPKARRISPGSPASRTRPAMRIRALPIYRQGLPGSFRFRRGVNGD